MSVCDDYPGEWTSEPTKNGLFKIYDETGNVVFTDIIESHCDLIMEMRIDWEELSSFNKTLKERLNKAYRQIKDLTGSSQ